MKEKILERFLHYVKINTQSDETSESTPSTPGQLDFARKLTKELKSIGLFQVSLTGEGYVLAELPSNTSSDVPVIGFIAHMDTSPDMSGENVNPQVFKNYNGSPIILNKSQNIVLSPEEFPELINYHGNTLITTDGTTLLGADDKAGIAEIVTAVEYLIKHPEIKHGTIKIAFTPDEEIGRGADHFNVSAFSADFAYTLDGGQIGELEYENFNAAIATVNFKGRNVHPGTAKDKMINSQQMAMDFHSRLPKREKPEFTEGYEGFFHLIEMQGDVENSMLRYLVRDHSLEKFNGRKKFLLDLAGEMNNINVQKRISVEIKDQYFNMRSKIEPVFHIVELAKNAMIRAGITPQVKPIRGGTDGSRLSYMGLPCPNIFTGGHNYHGKYEFIPLESMEKAVQVIIEIITQAAAKKLGH